MTTTAMTIGTAARSPATVRKLSTAASLALHIVPGALMTAGFVISAPVAESLGFPPIAALMAAILLVLVPVELGVLAWAARSERVRFAELIPYRRGIPLRTWLWLVPTLIVLAFLGFGLHQAIEPMLIDRFFGWLPDWFVSPIAIDGVGGYSATAWILTFAAYAERVPRHGRPLQPQHPGREPRGRDGVRTHLTIRGPAACGPGRRGQRWLRCRWRPDRHGDIDGNPLRARAGREGGPPGRICRGAAARRRLAGQAVEHRRLDRGSDDRLQLLPGAVDVHRGR